MKTQDSNGQPRPDKDKAMPAKDASGEPVPVVERDLQQRDAATDKVDKVITPKSIKSHEQNAEKLQDKVGQVERKLDR